MICIKFPAITQTVQKEDVMPKGYNDRAINGLLELLKGCFECVLQEVEDGKPIKQALEEELGEIELRLRADHRPTTTKFEQFGKPAS